MPVAENVWTRADKRTPAPCGNITGFASFEATLGGKWPELLSEIAPGLDRAAIMFNPDTAAVSTYVPPFEAAARSLKVVPIITPVRSDVEIETAIIALGREPRGGLVVMPGAFTVMHRAPVILAAARNNVPTVYSRSHSTRRAACRSPSAVSDKIRDGRQSQDRQGARS
jgi:putative ABC transport system substrate-binding protein